MKLFTGLKQIREFERRQLPFLKSVIDFDIVIEIGYAEELGFETVWLGEHHFCNYLCPSSQVFAAAVAQRTTRLRIGTGDAEECIDRIAQAKEAVGNTHYWLYADLGGLPHEEVWASLRRFAEKVMPKFR